MDCAFNETGSVIIRLPLAVSVLGTSHLTTTCHGCFLTPSEKEILLASGNLSSKTVRVKLSRCSGCKTLHYCSRVRHFPFYGFTLLGSSDKKKLIFRMIEQNRNVNWQIGQSTSKNARPFLDCALCIIRPTPTG